MARQIIDTTTNNGSYIGDPAKTAFEKTNANFAEVYGWAGTGSLAKLVGGNSFTGDQSFNQGSTRFIPGPSGTSDTIFVRSEGATGVTIDATNNANSSYAALKLRGASVNIDGLLYASDNIICRAAVFSSQVFSATADNVMLATQGAATVYLRPNGIGSSSGQATLTAAGTFAAPTITQTSSADVKDNLEGFSGSASDLIDRLVVITHTYRPEFIDDGGETHISLLAENVRDVIPSATTGDHTVIETEQYDEDVVKTLTRIVDLLDSDGNPVIGIDGEVVTTHISYEVTEVETKSRQIERHVPLGVKVMELLSVSLRAHQEKNKRIAALESAVSSLAARIDAAGI